jgi:ribonuclease P protein component
MAGGRPQSGRCRIHAKKHPFTGYLNLDDHAGKQLVLAIGRRAGKAVVRSRVKRILRDLFRKAQDSIPEGAVVVIAADADLTATPRKAVRLAATGLLKRLVQSWRTGRWRQDRSAGPSSGSSGFTS